MFRQPFSRDSSRVSGSNNNKKKKSHASQTTVTPPQILLKKVIFNKINDRESIKLFVERRVEELIGFDDEVLIGIIYNTMFEEKDDERLLTDAQDGVELYKQLLPFLEAENTDTFMEELWEILTNIDEETGIPIKFIEERKLAKQKRDEVAIIIVAIIIIITIITITAATIMMIIQENRIKTIIEIITIDGRRQREIYHMIDRYRLASARWLIVMN
jgi:uncharacterized membrane protein YgcG